jgi:uncharacterized protein YkwD
MKLPTRSDEGFRVQTATLAPALSRRRSALRAMSLAMLVVVCFEPSWALPVDAPSHRTEIKGKSATSRKIPFDKQEVQLIEDTIRRMTNLVRSRKGLDPVRPSSALHLVALRHSEHMCRSRILKHESDVYPQGWRRLLERMAVARVRSGGENIAFHTISPDPRRWAFEVFKGWLRSPPHRKNLLDPRYRYLGVGIGQCGGDVAYGTQMFSAEPGVLPKPSEVQRTGRQ